jgi:hypothetical protein
MARHAPCRARQTASAWIQLLLSTPVVLWAGLPFFQRAWASVVNRSLNMFSLIALGTGAAYLYSLIATFAPGLFPVGFRGMDNTVRSILNRHRSSPFSCCSVRFWNCARANKPAEQFARCSTWHAEDGMAIG